MGKNTHLRPGFSSSLFEFPRLKLFVLYQPFVAAYSASEGEKNRIFFVLVACQIEGRIGC